MKKTILTISLSISLIIIAIIIASFYKHPSTSNLNYTCDADAKLCADGSTVGRSGPNCEFTTCPDTQTATSSSSDNSDKQNSLKLPLADALNRVSKKPFGIKITPTNSPVQPERFSGYHTGTDFETTEQEQDSEVKAYTLCDGVLKLKKWSSGYGGVAIQSCKINDQAVTVIYGHLQLASITTKVGDQLVAGSQLGILGKGQSQETDQERKHLHLAIHRGTALILLGYTPSASQLKDWLNPMDYLK